MVKVTEKETAAIEALKAAIKALPKTLFFEIDMDGEVLFWKRTGPGEARGAAPALRCKRAVTQ